MTVKNCCGKMLYNIGPWNQFYKPSHSISVIMCCKKYYPRFRWNNSKLLGVLQHWPIGHQFLTNLRRRSLTCPGGIGPVRFWHNEIVRRPWRCPISAASGGSTSMSGTVMLSLLSVNVIKLISSVNNGGSLQACICPWHDLFVQIFDSS
jgi:hypothetical protein